MFPQLKRYASLQESVFSVSLWLRVLVIALAILACMAVIGVCLWTLGHISQAVILLLLGAVIATVISPLIRWLERLLPRPLAIAIVYFVVFVGLVVLLYFLLNIAIDQTNSLIQYIQSLINSNGNSRLKPILDTLEQWGFTQQQLRSFGQQITGQLRGIVNSVFPFISNLFSFILNVILVALLSIYFLLAGPRVTHWLRHKTPVVVRGSCNFLLDTLERVIGGNFRGLLLLATIISTITGVGLSFIGVPYPFLLSVVAFILEFIPIIGFYITATSIMLVALTQGWVTALIALAFVILLQALEGEVLAPRIIGGAVGINPIIAIGALVAGSQLYGIIGAFFAAPVAGVVQAVLVALWHQWKQAHPEQFPEEDSDDRKPKQDQPSTSSEGG
jgi:predicted PurR-regulated permease PerM